MGQVSGYRSPQEKFLLFLALALVVGICVPLWQWAPSSRFAADEWARWTPERIGRLLLGPEQIACYVCFLWAALILIFRRLEVMRQYRAFRMDLLPQEEGLRVLPEDARSLQRRVDQLGGRGGPYLLVAMIRSALGKYAVSKSSEDVRETLRMQAEVDLGRMVTTMATLHYLAWALPAIGFLGTVRGLAGGLSMSSKVGEELKGFLAQATGHLTVAFDCTLVALSLSLVLMYFLHTVQRDEENLVLDCQQYCLDHLVNRLYDLDPTRESA